MVAERRRRLDAVVDALVRCDPREIIVRDGSGQVVEWQADPVDGRWVIAQIGGLEVETSVLTHLQRQATSDPLTGVGNRRLLDRTIDELDDPAERIGVVLLDIDDFKQVNDAHGHAIGDQVLHQIGTRLDHACRPDDVAVRFGGDEFVVLLRRLADGAGAADAIVARLAEALHQPFRTEAGLLDIRCSLGVALGPALEARALVRGADRSMYASKRPSTVGLDCR